jgi:hypothetical protein
VRRSVRPVCDREKSILKEKRQSRYTSHVCGGASIKPMAMEVSIFFEVPIVLKCANFGGGLK